MYILKEIYEQMLYGMYAVPPEAGGILGEQQGVITNVYFDFSSKEKNRAIYIPDVNLLNKIICEWRSEKINFIGMFHSHLKHADTLSCEDVRYVTSVMEGIRDQVEFLLFPIVIPQHKIIFYKVFRSLEIAIENVFIIGKEDAKWLY